MGCIQAKNSHQSNKNQNQLTLKRKAQISALIIKEKAMPLKEYYEKTFFQEILSSKTWKGKKPNNLNKYIEPLLIDNEAKSKSLEEITQKVYPEEEENMQKEMLFHGFLDTRKQVSDLWRYPYCCIGLVTGKFGIHFYHGSGCLIGPRIVLTCAHNLYQRSQNIEASDVQFFPTSNRNQGNNFRVKKYYFPQQYKQRTEEKEKYKFDIGLLELENEIFEEYGYLGIDTSTENITQNEEIEICGYPKNKQRKMLTAFGSVERVKESFIEYQIPTSCGQSGSPIIKRVNGEEYVVGIHIMGNSLEKVNIGLRLNGENREIISCWMEQIMQKIRFPKTNEQWKQIQYNMGNKYIGEWKNEAPHGKGIAQDSKGNIYKGIFVNGKRNGYGICYYENGAKYKGYWKNGKKNGKGIYFSKNGFRYEGEFKDGEKHGKGIQYYSDGLKYVGEWKDNMKNGKGFYCCLNMKIQYVEFRDNKQITETIYNQSHQEEQDIQKMENTREYFPIFSKNVLKMEQEDYQKMSVKTEKFKEFERERKKMINLR